MTQTTLIGGRILKPSGIHTNDVLNFGNKFLSFEPLESASKLQPRDETNIITLPSNWIIAPGFVDIHIHGCSDHDVMDATPEALQTMAATLVRHGVTNFLGTTMTMGPLEIEAALKNARAYCHAQDDNLSTSQIRFLEPSPPIGATMRGVHLEGPFISAKAVGAQNPEFIQKPDITLVEAYKDIIKIVTYAPEEDVDFLFTKALVDFGIVPSIGHTACSYDTASAAFDAGASHMTHLFNAMTPLHHREPGAVGAALALDYTLEIIADNVHIRPELYNLIHKLKSDQLALITDSMRAGCMKCGLYSLGGQKVIVDHNSARLENGALAGSILTMDQAVRNYYHELALAKKASSPEEKDALLTDALRSASTVPARIAGLTDTGSIEQGKRADLVILDENLQVRMTFVEGKLCHQQSS